MPDVPSLALSILGLYFFQRWIGFEPDRPIRSTRLCQSFGGQASFLASGFCISLSILIKLPSILISAPLACVAFQRFRMAPLGLGAAFRNVRLWIFAAIVLLPSAIWYGHAYEISLDFYPHHFFGAGGVRIMSAAWYLKIAKEIPTSTLTPFVCVLGGVGALITRSTSRARPFRWWLAVMILFMVIVGYGNRHPWYQLPLVPIGAAFAGPACALIATKISNRAIKLVLSILLIGSFSFSTLVYARKFYEPAASPMRDAGLELQRITPADALIAGADNGDPTIFYYAARKGWHFLEKDGIYEGDPRDSAQAIVDLEGLRARGASYLVFTSNTLWWLDYYEQLRQHIEATSTLLEATSEFKIYGLNPAPK